LERVLLQAADFFHLSLLPLVLSSDALGEETPPQLTFYA
jgi:hypothetical protein